jgi:hypothetical protein
MAINRSKKTRADVPPEKFSPQQGVVKVFPLEEFTMQGADGLDAVIAISNEIHGWLGKLKEALLSGDDEQLKIYARRLCGLPPESPAPPKPKGKR